MSPISQSSPYPNNNEISMIYQCNISDLFENTTKVLITDTLPSSIKCYNQQDHTPKINIKCKTSHQTKGHTHTSAPNVH